jgi:hypothetical protein
MSQTEGKDVFTDVAQPQSPRRFLDFSAALQLVKMGMRATRTGWNGKDMFVYMVPSSEFKVSRPPLLGIFALDTDIHYRAHIDMRYADGSCGVWSPSNSDLLANDWECFP